MRSDRPAHAGWHVSVDSGDVFRASRIGLLERQPFNHSRGVPHRRWRGAFHPSRYEVGTTKGALHRFGHGHIAFRSQNHFRTFVTITSNPPKHFQTLPSITDVPPKHFRPIVWIVNDALKEFRTLIGDQFETPKEFGSLVPVTNDPPKVLWSLSRITSEGQKGLGTFIPAMNERQKRFRTIGFDRCDPPKVFWGSKHDRTLPVSAAGWSKCLKIRHGTRTQASNLHPTTRSNRRTQSPT